MLKSASKIIVMKIYWGGVPWLLLQVQMDQQFCDQESHPGSWEGLSMTTACYSTWVTDQNISLVSAMKKDRNSPVEW